MYNKNFAYDYNRHFETKLRTTSYSCFVKGCHKSVKLTQRGQEVLWVMVVIPDLTAA